MSRYTVVSFHAHPDDEALLTAGTLARVAADGHRVVLVSATDGEAGLVAGAVAADGDLGARRRAELRRSARALGCNDVRFLGYADSGLDGLAIPTGPETRAAFGPTPFARADTDEAAARLAAILKEVEADVLTVYDPAGGYGHPDHVKVNSVGVAAARLAGTRVVLEATVDRRRLVGALRLLRRIGVIKALRVRSDEWRPGRFEQAYTDPARITHRVDVRRFAAAKRAAMAAHASQSTADTTVRTLAVFVRLPSWLFRFVFGHEWFVERGRGPLDHPLDDIFDTLRPHG